MTKVSLSVFATNATVTYDVTPSGKSKFPIKINYDAGTAMDRVQECHDYDTRLPSSFKLIEGTRVFKNKNCYITFAMYRRDDKSNLLVTCKCNQQELTQSEAVDLIEKGMKLALEKNNS
ncbi:hypothetical protein [Shewanella sp. S1-58-MNA-CIBAN-0166]|uniref:hypothetical protein n=1 Tax=Shewanella sp. S1-58-MNA-CIBAN-0166 TaxID=3140467 RepID=UPI003318533A